MSANLYSLVRATRGPIVLIVMGVLFWLDQSDQIGFGRTWPVLIILIGVMKLIERLLAPAIPPMPPIPPVSMPPLGGTR
jgi:hypothetical protein